MARSEPGEGVPRDLDQQFDVVTSYNARFGTNFSCPPFGLSMDFFVEVLAAALAEDRPVAEDFDWYQDMPPDAVA